MRSRLAKTIVGAIIAVALAVAVSYGLISQQTADRIRTQADQTLSNDRAAPDAPPQPAPRNPEAPPRPRPPRENPAPRP